MQTLEPWYQTLQPRQTWRRVFRGVLIAIVLAACLLWLVVSLVNELQLSQNGRTIIASVTDSRIYTSASNKSSGRTDYEVQYQFKLDGDSTLYSYSDETGRQNLWATLAKPDWDTAVASRQINVTYLSDNPWVNHPVASPSTTEHLITIALLSMVSLAMLILSILSPTRIKLFLAKRRTIAHPPSQISRMRDN